MRLARAVKELTELVRHKGRDIQVHTEPIGYPVFFIRVLVP